jgi:molybdopterin converting factor subunit 1
MQVRLRYFAALRERVGRDGESLELPQGASVAAVRELLAERYPPAASLLARCAAAVNREYVPEATLTDGDELVFIPPVGGG